MYHNHATDHPVDTVLAPSEHNGNGHTMGTSRVWDIRDASGNLVARHYRKDTIKGKQLWWTQPDGSNGLNGTHTADLPLYGSERSGQWPDDVPVIVCEGEPAADALAQVHSVVVATVSGAGGTPNSEPLELLRDRPVTLWADNDDAGRDHMRRLAGKLQGVASEVRIFEWPDGPEKGDAADHPAVTSRERGAVAELIEALAAAPVLGANSVIHEASRRPDSYRDGTRDTVRDNPRLRSTAFRDMGPPEPRRYLVDGLVPDPYVTLLHGDGGVAKSTLAMSLALNVARDNAGTWLGRAVEGGPVLYLDFELDAQEQNRRVRQLTRAEGLSEPPEGLRYMSALGVNSTHAFEGALADCKELGAKLVVVDSLGPALEGDAEAARDVIGFYQRVIQPFRAAGISVLVVDHQSKLQAGEKYTAKRAFGSVYKGNLARSVIQVEATERQQDLLVVRLRHVKHNFGTLADPFEIRLTFSEEEVRLEGVALEPRQLATEESLSTCERIRLALKDGPLYPEEIAQHADLEIKTVKNNLTTLRRSGEIVATGERDGQKEQVRLASQCPEPLQDGTRDAVAEDVGEGEKEAQA